MKRGIGLFVLALIVLILVFEIASSGFRYDGARLIKNYNAGERIKGIVNLSFNNENAKSLFTSNFLGNISLLKFLEANRLGEGEDFDCSTQNCKEQYSVEEQISRFSLEGEKTVGLKVDGRNVRIESLAFDISSDIAESCGNPPIFIDILADGEEFASSDSHGNETCSNIARNYGCFDRNLGNSEYSYALITREEICENVTVLPGPAYRVGGKIKDKTRGEVGRLEMEIFDFDGFSMGGCRLPTHTGGEQELECDIEYSSPERTNFLVCVRNNNYINADYSIKSEIRAPECGTSGRDVELFARPLKYGNVDMTVDNSLFLDSLLEDSLNYYLEENYELSDDGVNCEPYCVIPVKFVGAEQEIELNSVELVYRDGQVQLYTREFYELSVEEPRISSGFLMLDLEKANFIIPIGSDEDNFILRLNNNKVFEERINISESFDFSLNTRFAFLGRETEFTAIVNANITSSVWDFGDGVVEEVAGKSIRHRYLEEGEYELKVTLTRRDGATTTKAFRIAVGNPRESANATIKEYDSRIANINGQINSFEKWIADEIKKNIALVELENSLESLKIEFNEAEDDEQYTNVVNGLLELNVPYSVSATRRGELPMTVGFENIDVRYIEEISKEEADEEELLGNIITWTLENYDPKVEFVQISAFTDDGEEELLSSFKIKLNPKKEGEKAYLFIDYPMESIEFVKNYGQEDVDGATYIALEGEREIEFLVDGMINVEELGAYISPEISVFGIVEEILPEEKPEFKTGKFILWISILIAVFLIVYIILQEWYKKHYESHLFKNKNDLYNLINFIYNARIGGFDDDEVKNRLKEKKWKGEQIAYALRKLDGKRTGMWEIPIFKRSENKKVKAELERRHAEGIDPRFGRAL